ERQTRHSAHVLSPGRHLTGAGGGLWWLSRCRTGQRDADLVVAAGPWRSVGDGHDRFVSGLSGCRALVHGLSYCMVGVGRLAGAERDSGDRFRGSTRLGAGM
ncbi:FIG024006: iron uptake protein, partial [Pseudomonas fluorescens]